MKIRVKLFNQLRRFGPDGQSAFSIQLPEGSTVGDLLAHLNIPSDIPRTVLVDGRRVDQQANLLPDGEVVMMSLIEGG